MPDKIPGGGCIAPSWSCRTDAQPHRSREGYQYKRKGSRGQCTSDNRGPLQIAQARFLRSDALWCHWTYRNPKKDNTANITTTRPTR